MKDLSWPPRRQEPKSERHFALACSGPCEQGRIPCPAPEACRVREPGLAVRFYMWLRRSNSNAKDGLCWAIAVVLLMGMTAAWWPL